MDVILMERVEHLGQMGDVVTVKDGYARNYLLPQRKALRSTEENRERFERQRTELEARNLERRAEAESVGARMEGLRVVLIRQSSDTGQLYGSANARDIANGVTGAGFGIDRKQVLLDRGIKTLGVHPVRVALHPEVTVSVNVNVARSEAEAEQQEAALRPETAAPTEDEAAAAADAAAGEDPAVAAEGFFEDASLTPAGDPGQDAPAPDDPGPAAVPGSFRELEQWSEEHLDGKIRLHPRAIRAAKKSKFEDVALAYRALLILRDHYVPMRLEGGADRQAAYREALAGEGLKEEPTFAGTRAGEYGDAYFIQHGGRKRQLERHLKGSNARDERHGFRLYFFWDDDDREVVVGWLPNHLPTRIS